jgi:hypothetical protein
MTEVATASSASKNRRHHTLANGAGYFRTNYMASSADSPGSPMCYLIEQDPDCVINAHYHQANQFQVFVGGSGALGKRNLEPLIVHYTDAHTPYGPISSHAEGVQYLTLREEYDPGARFLPEEVAGLKHVRRRHVTTEPIARAAPATLPRLTETVARMLFETHADGLAAWLVEAGPHATIGNEARETQIRGGQFWLVLTGSVTHRDATLDAETFIYVPHKEPAPHLSAGPGGGEVLILQFPDKARGPTGE